MLSLVRRIFFKKTNTARIVVGLDGTLSNDWNWQLAYNYGRNTGTDGWTFDQDIAKVANTLDENVCSYENGAAIPCGDWFGSTN